MLASLYTEVSGPGIQYNAQQKLRKSNPWSGDRCGRPECSPCRVEGGGDCWKEGLTYSLICGECGGGVWEESGRNGYARGGKHLCNQLVEDEYKSVLELHSKYHHNGAEVTLCYESDWGPC